MHQNKVLGPTQSTTLLVVSWESPTSSQKLDFLICKETTSPHMVGTQGQSGRTKAPLSSLSDGVHMGFSSKVQLFRHKLLPLSPSPPPLPAF